MSDLPPYMHKDLTRIETESRKTCLTRNEPWQLFDPELASRILIKYLCYVPKSEEQQVAIDFRRWAHQNARPR